MRSSQNIRIMIVKQDKIEKSPRDAYQVALTTALEDLAEARAEGLSATNKLAEADARVAELTNLIRSLLAFLPKEQAVTYANAIRQQVIGEQRLSHAGPVHEKVVKLFAGSQKREWTTLAVQEALENQGAEADPKAVHNVLNYLNKKGRLRRISRGRYVIRDIGIAFDLDHDLSGSDPTEGGCMDD